MEHPFWQKLFETSLTQPFDQLIVVPSYQLKQWVYDVLFEVIGKNGTSSSGIAYPLVMTLDEWVESCFGVGGFFEKGFEKLVFKKTAQQVLADPMYQTEFYQSDGFLEALHALIYFWCQQDLDESELESYARHHKMGLCGSLPLMRPFLKPILDTYLATKKKWGVFNIADFYLLTLENNFSHYAEKLALKRIFWVGFFEAIPLKMKVVKKMMELGQLSYFLLAGNSATAMGQTNLFFLWLKKNGVVYDEISSNLSDSVALAKTQVVALDSYEEEVKYLASYIHQTLAKNPGISIQDFMIVCPHKNVYQLYFKKIFPKYHLPLSLFYPTSLTDTPLGVFLNHLWDLILSKNERVLWVRFLKSPFAQEIKINETIYAVDADFIRKISLELGIQKESQKWLDLWEEHPAFFDEKLQAHYVILETLFKLIQNLRESGSAVDFLEHLKILFKAFQLDQKISYFAEVMELFYQLELFYGLDRNSSFKLDSVIQDLQLLFDTHFSFLNTTPETGVPVMEKIESFGIYKKYVMICGFIQGYWPGPENLDSFIFSHLRQQAQTELLITYPKADKDEPLLVSYFMDQLPDVPIQKGVALPHDAEDRLIEWGRRLRENQTPFLDMDASILDRYRAYQASVSAYYCNHYWGCFENDVIQKELAAYTTNALSVTRLESYQRCPYHFFFRYLLKEEVEEELGLDIAGHVWGSLIHQIWYRFYLQSHLPRDWSQHPDLCEKARQNLISISMNVLDSYPQDTLYWEARKRLILGSEDRVGLVDLFIEQEQHSFFSLQPTVFEESFLFPVYHPQTHQLELTLTGKIDAILTQPDSSFFAIMDYKTGSSIPDYSELENFHSLQLPVYMLAKKKQLQNLQLAGGIIYQIRDQDHIEKKILCLTEAAKSAKVFSLGRKKPLQIDDAYFEKLTHHLVALKTCMAKGFFGFVADSSLPQTKRNLCKYCAYLYFCRYPQKFVKY